MFTDKYCKLVRLDKELILPETDVCETRSTIRFIKFSNELISPVIKVSPSKAKLVKLVKPANTEISPYILLLELK